MTVAGPAFIIPGTARPPFGSCFGWDGLNQMMTKTYWEHLEELHWFGTEVPSVYADKEYITDYSKGDHAQEGRHATNNGAIPGPSFFTSGADAFYDFALTGDALNDMGTPGQFTAFIVGKFPNFNSMGIGPRTSSAANGWSICRGGSPGRYTLEVFYASGADPASVTINADSDTGSVYEFLACTFRFDATVQEGKLYRIKPGGVLQTSATMVLTEEVRSLSPIRIGRSIPSNYVAPSDIVGGGVLGKAFTGAEIETKRGLLQPFLASLPTPIVI